MFAFVFYSAVGRHTMDDKGKMRNAFFDFGSYLFDLIQTAPDS
jgi:hypothetical protein